MSMRATAAATETMPQNHWITSPRWDLFWLSCSALLVAVPPLTYHYWRVGATGIDLLVTLLIGGPHMYATFLRTVLEPRFRDRHPLLAWIPVIVIPIFVVSTAVIFFEGLLTLFFTWASIHICDQASYIASCYRKRGGVTRFLDRPLDFLVAMASLYAVAMYRFVEGTFVISGHAIWFPPFLKGSLQVGGLSLNFADVFALGASALIATWAVRSWNQARRGELGLPYFIFMGLTMAVGLMVPMMKELSVSFQGFNAWHSFQYLGLTFLALNQTESAGRISLGFVRSLSRPGQFFRYYGWNVLLTAGAGVIVGFLVVILKLPMEQCYFSVVLSFLLVHYFHDHILFSEPSNELAQPPA